MQALARQWGYGQAQRQWKRRKDAGRTVYLQLLIDSSGSMQRNNRLQRLKTAVNLASSAINSGNQVGMISFSDQPVLHLPLQPFDGAGRARLLAAVQRLRPDGATALYDGMAVAMAELMRARRSDPDGRFVLLLLNDGARTSGLQLSDLSDVIRHSGINTIPMSYGEVDEGELNAIAALRESSVYKGTPKLILPLMHELFQTNL